MKRRKLCEFILLRGRPRKEFAVREFDQKTKTVSREGAKLQREEARKNAACCASASRLHTDSATPYRQTTNRHGLHAASLWTTG